MEHKLSGLSIINDFLAVDLHHVWETNAELGTVVGSVSIHGCQSFYPQVLIFRMTRFHQDFHKDRVQAIRKR
jgi:hypothetical protein